jgi:hypothetical protein
MAAWANVTACCTWPVPWSRTASTARRVAGFIPGSRSLRYTATASACPHHPPKRSTTDQLPDVTNRCAERLNDEAAGSPPQEFQTMMQMITGMWVSQIIRAVADLSLAEHLADGPRTADDIAAREKSDPSATYRLMRACVNIGLLTYEGDAFAGTPLLALLSKDSPMSMKSLALAMTAPGHWLPFGRMPEAVRQGRSQVTETLGKSLFDYFEANPDEGALFGAAMTVFSTPAILEAVQILDVSGVSTVVDVGGANGAFVLELLAHNSHLKGVVLDLPHSIEGAKTEAKRRGLEDRATVVAGDFFQNVPEGDLLLVKNVLHDWDDDSCVRILQRCRESLLPGGRIAVLEIVMEEHEAGLPALLDMTMLAVAAGKERTLAEFDALFARAGLQRVSVVRLNAPSAVIEVAPV